jgi:hypothetical protein
MDISEILEEELSFLRQILSNLKLEETALVTGNHAWVKQIYEERLTIRKLSQEKRKLRKVWLKNTPISKEKIEETSQLEQIKILNTKIVDQVKTNHNLKEQNQSPLVPTPTKKKKKKSLLLEEEPS